MVKDADTQGLPGGAAAEAVGTLSADFEAGRFKLTCDGVCWDRSLRKLLAFSAAGGGTAVRAVRAQLYGEQKVSFSFEEDGGAVWKLAQEPEGYGVYVKGLGLNTWHIVAVSKSKDFLPCKSDEGVWQYLQKHATTPVHRDWVPELVRLLEKGRHLTDAGSAGYIQGALLRLWDGDLDKIVQGCLRAKKFKIVA